MIEIHWPCDMAVPSKACEKRMMKVLHRRGEWGRGRDLPQHRKDEIQASCNKNHMTLYQALSLRRTILRSFPNGMARVSQSSSMGSEIGQRQLSSLFEQAVNSFLASQSSNKFFLTEKELQAEMKAGNMPRGPTPDVLFLKPVRINGQLVKWLDAKQYYASASYAHNPKLPNGKLSKQAQRYRQYYGEKGAFVFAQGYCVQLQQIISDALLLDATPLDMSAVQALQDSQN